MKSNFIITHKFSLVNLSKLQFFKHCFIQTSSQVATSIIRLFASVLERATTVCFCVAKTPDYLQREYNIDK